MAMKLGRSATASTWIAASPEQVWRVISDVRRGGEWSGESLGCEWLGDTAQPAPGARLAGRNTRGWIGWSRVSEILAADPPRELAWRTLPTRIYPDSTEWHIHLKPEDGGTRVTEEMRILNLPRLEEIGLYWLIPAHRDRRPDLAADLERLKRLIEGSADPAGSTP